MLAFKDVSTGKLIGCAFTMEQAEKLARECDRCKVEYYVRNYCAATAEKPEVGEKEPEARPE